MNCLICAVASNNYDEWELHVTSEKHVENAKRYKPISMPVPVATLPPPQATPIPSSTPSNIPPLLPPKELEELTAKLQANLNQQLNQKALKEIVAKDRKEWNCINCKVTCQALCSWEAHLASHKHRKNRHKFHTYPGISKEFVKKKYRNSFVRAAETIGNEFIEDGVVFYCKRCDVRMQDKHQLEIHMSSNQHKINHPIAPLPEYHPTQNHVQMPSFESSYGYGFRYWSHEQNVNQRFVSPDEIRQQQELEAHKLLVEKAKNDLLARFPYYAINMQNEQAAANLSPEDIPMPVEAPKPVADPYDIPTSDFAFDNF